MDDRVATLERHAVQAARRTRLRMKRKPPTPEQIETVRMYLGRRPVQMKRDAA